MHALKVIAMAAATVLLLTSGVRNAGATTITITASVSDRGLDIFPWDGMNANVFGNPSVIAVNTPPIGTPQASEERSGVEFPLAAIPAGSIINSVTLRLDPQGPVSTNIGLGAGEASEIHGYAGDGVIQVADLNDSLLVGSITGPVANGQVLVVLSSSWLQGLVDASNPYAGLMFKGVPGPIQVLYSFDSAFSGVPVAERPTLIIETSDSAPVIPEPSTMILFGTGVAATALRRRFFRRRDSPHPRS